jgi:hypothetical protein
MIFSAVDAHLWINSTTNKIVYVCECIINHRRAEGLNKEGV